MSFGGSPADHAHNARVHTHTHTHTDRHMMNTRARTNKNTRLGAGMVRRWDDGGNVLAKDAGEER